MRIQIIDLPSQHIGDVITNPYLLVISELRHEATPPIVEHFRKDGFDHCAGVIATTERVVIGEESLHEIQQREERRPRVAKSDLGLPYGALISATTPDGRTDVMTVGRAMQTVFQCPEQQEGRGCACSLGAEDCPINGKTPRSIGVMDIAPEERAVSVTENEGGVRVAHIALDVDQTPEELGSDVAAIVEEQREGKPCRGDSHCPAFDHLQGCFRPLRDVGAYAATNPAL